MAQAAAQSAAQALSLLTHNRWALPILAKVRRDHGCKLVTLTRQLGASPASVKRALTRLAELDLVVRNPGYGHPMRPEYVLGGAGRGAAELPGELVAWSARIDPDVLNKWQLPVLVALGPHVRRFGQVRGQLPGATPRAVTLALKSHAALGLVSRRVQDGYPPSPIYVPTTLALGGREPALHLGRLLASVG
jgi:DNA-binding HxlR family transcriptional regulator